MASLDGRTSNRIEEFINFSVPRNTYHSENVLSVDVAEGF